MVNIAVCDDNKVTLDFLSREIDRLMNENLIEHDTHKFITGGELIEYHLESKIDIVFLDIALPDIDGFEVAKKIRSKSERTYIIFITTNESLVYDSFEFQPFYFIPKAEPEVTLRRLEKAIEMLNNNLIASKPIEIPLSFGKKEMVNPMNILYIKSSGNNIVYYLGDNRTIKTRRKLDDALKELSSRLFLRLHKSCIVNMRYIQEINFPKSYVIMSDGNTVNISRSHKQAVECAYSEFVQNLGR